MLKVGFDEVVFQILRKFANKRGRTWNECVNIEKEKRMRKMLLGCLLAFCVVSFTTAAQDDGKDKKKEKVECGCKECGCKKCTCGTDCSDCSGCRNYEECRECRDCDHEGHCCDYRQRRHHHRHHRHGGCCGC